MKPVTLTPFDRRRIGTVPLGIEALREVKRELRRPVRDRDDACLIACAQEACIQVDDCGRRFDAACFTRHSCYSFDGVRLDWHRVEATVSDTSLRGAIRRLLTADLTKDAAHRCASAPVEWHPTANP